VVRRLWRTAIPAGNVDNIENSYVSDISVLGIVAGKIIDGPAEDRGNMLESADLHPCETENDCEDETKREQTHARNLVRYT